MKRVKSIYRPLVLLCFFLFPCCPAYGDSTSAQIGSGLIRYSEPMNQQYRLDWCLDWTVQCGEPAATAWCKQNNLSRSNSWKQAANIGKTTPTKTLKSGKICDKDFCDGFSEIVCENPEPGIFYDFIQKAPSAKWTNAWQILPYPGSGSEDKGFVRVLHSVKLENQRTYREVLETHPHWQPRGRIVGRYSNINLPAHGTEFRAELGFIDGAGVSDGVYFEIWAEFPQYNGIPLRREYHKKMNGYLISDFSQDLSLFSNMTGTIALSIDAGEKSSAQDWAVWVRPRLVSMKNEYAFASFIGGAIGSKRSGNTLINPWGGKSGYLYGDVVLYLAFAHVTSNHPIRIDSYYKEQFMGTTNLGSVHSGQKEKWFTLRRTQEGPWRETVVFNGTYVGDLRYTISKMGE